jgi:hypothetical protein
MHEAAITLVTGIEFWIVVQAAIFVFIFLLGFNGAIYAVYSMKAGWLNTGGLTRRVKIIKIYLWALAFSVWVAVLSGTFSVYPLYRANLSEGVSNMGNYPNFFTAVDPKIAELQDFSLDWITHVAAMAPIAATVVAFIVSYYGPNLAKKVDERHTVMMFFTLAFITTAAAGLLGAFIHKGVGIR